MEATTRPTTLTLEIGPDIGGDIAWAIARKLHALEVEDSVQLGIPHPGPFDAPKAPAYWLNKAEAVIATLIDVSE